MNISELKSKQLSNAVYVDGRNPYIKGKKSLPIRKVESKVLLYHGSNHIVGQPELGKGKNNNDYGQGFYTTTILDRADEWALMMPGESIRNEYEIDLCKLNILNLDEYGPLAWIAEVMFNRGPGSSKVEPRLIKVFCNKYRVKQKNIDIVIGYRADDSYFMIINSFLNNELSVDEVVQLFYKAKLWKQIFIKSQKAFNRIKFLKFNKIPSNKLQYAMNNDKNARRIVKEFISNRRYTLGLRQISMQGKLTFTESLIKNLVYNKKDRNYYET